MSNGDRQNEGKRGFPGGMLLILLLVLFVIMLVQSFGSQHSGKVGFSYQLEHLVNLDLIRPEDSAKTALNDRLVSFSGRFRDQFTETSRQRWNYLETLNQRMGEKEQQQRLEASLGNTRDAVLQAATYYLQLMGGAVPVAGYTVIAAEGPEIPAVQISSVPPFEGTTMVQVEAAVRALQDPAEAMPVAAGRDLVAKFIEEVRSPALGIGQESIKTQLRNLTEQVEQLNLSDRLAAGQALSKVSSELKSIMVDMGKQEHGSRLNALRSVRDYRVLVSQMQALQQTSIQTISKLDRARAALGNQTWFYRDQELSSRQLEAQDPEKYQQWFNQAKSEWDAFTVNKGLMFRAPDQPRNLVLERNFRSQEPAPNYIGYILTLAPVILLGALLYFAFSRQMKGSGGGAMNFGKAPVKVWQKGAGKVTFKDVAGIEEAKEELTEIVDFLKDPGRFTALGARIPRGALLIGAPGTGKTLMAKAVAGEADRPFFSISGSDFVEMFVGVGASRIRDLFDQAKKNAPCIVFIDEIDAVGRHRGAGMGGGHDEREQTLNQLLVEMDGFGTNEGIILMAATNRPDVLDKALLRPGRFDRRITIDLPDLKGRLEILKVHARKLKLDPDVELMGVARATPGASGADLANILNEAALLAARRRRSAISAGDVVDACDKVRFGKERRSLELDAREKLSTAYHEVGHALVGLCVSNSDPVEKVTIIPRGRSLGATHFLPEKNRHSYWRNQAIDQLAVLMGGRAAEELFVGDVSSGAQQDIRQATSLARAMVCEWGMSDGLGLIAYDERDEAGYYLGMNSYKEKNYSDQTADKIDFEVKKLVDDAYIRACDMLKERKEDVERITSALMEFETLDSEDLKEIMDNAWDVERKRQRLLVADQKFKIVPPPLPPIDGLGLATT